MIDPAALLLILMVVGLGFALISGFPVAFSLAGVAFLTGLLGIVLSEVFALDLGRLDWGYMALFPNRIFGIMLNEVLLAVPLFIFMGVMLERSKVAEDLLNAMAILMGGIRGGLSISVTIVGALLAASTGIVGATVVTMGLISLPIMLKKGYEPGFAAGSIAAAGTLGQIIPPSIVLILLSDVLSNAYQKAQRDMGIFSPEPLSVGELFMGALLPGLALVGLYILYQLSVAWFKPSYCPPIDEQRLGKISIGEVLAVLLPPLVLIVSVLGSILSGIATPTEAASVGAVGSIFLGGMRAVKNSKTQLLIFLGMIALITIVLIPFVGGGSSDVFFSIKIILLIIGAIGLALALQAAIVGNVLRPAMDSVLRVTVMIYAILIGAALFSLVFRGLGGDHYVTQILTAMPGGTIGAITLVMVVMFILGFFLDFIEITFVVVPIVAPVLFSLGVDPIWLGVMMAINLQTSFLTPPFGFALFYLRGVAPPELKTAMLYRGIIPFILLQILALIIIAIFPSVATWLPQYIFN
jgi:tripartite ATP-independent transporter DctM subunit